MKLVRWARASCPGYSNFSPQSMSSMEWSYKFVFWTGWSEGIRTTGHLTCACVWVRASQVGLKRLSFKRMMCTIQIPEANFCSHVTCCDFLLSTSIAGKRKSSPSRVESGVPLGCGCWLRGEPCLGGPLIAFCSPPCGGLLCFVFVVCFFFFFYQCIFYKDNWTVSGFFLLNVLTTWRW